MEYETNREAARECAQMALKEFGWSKSKVKANTPRVLQIMQENGLQPNNLSRVLSEMHTFRKAKP